MDPTEKQKVILVVDDDILSVKLLRSHLSDNGYRVMSSTDAADGLQMAVDERPDLIVLDVMMPIINGYNFCQLLKSQEEYKAIPIIFMTSRDLKEDKEIGKKMGADAYLTKPVVPEELIAAVSKLLNKS
ncbi:MAG: response regulator [Candidatus Omnitrophica bacterium]|nr:response regulator [Candidatus Omnitrophota bacterium]